jgi:hypothetical protein
MAIDHMLFNKLKWFNVADNADNITAGSQKFIKNYIGRKATAGAVVAWYTRSTDAEDFISNVPVNVGDTITYQIINKNNEICLSVDNDFSLHTSPRPFFKLSEFLSKGGKLS